MAGTGTEETNTGASTAASKAVKASDEAPPPRQEKDIEAIKAAARAYALSGTTNSKKRSRKKEATRARLFPPHAGINPHHHHPIYHTTVGTTATAYHHQPPVRGLAGIPGLPKVTQHRTTVPATKAVRGKNSLPVTRTSYPSTAYPHPAYTATTYPPQPFSPGQYPAALYSPGAQQQLNRNYPPVTSPSANGSINGSSSSNHAAYSPNQSFQKGIAVAESTVVAAAAAAAAVAPANTIPADTDATGSPGKSSLSTKEQLEPQKSPQKPISVLEYGEDYEKFVQSLWGNNNDEENDDEEFQFREDEDEDEDEDPFALDSLTAPGSSPGLEDVPDDFYEELAEELGWLEEEDMEAAVATLLDHPPNAQGAAGNDASVANGTIKEASRVLHAAGGASLPTKSTTLPSAYTTTPPARSVTNTPADQKEEQMPPTPLRESYAAAASATRMEVTDEQYKKLTGLLQGHFQLLVQQAALAGHAANHTHTHVQNPSNRLGIESTDDLVEILDLSTSMLQDLEQNRRDAVVRQQCIASQTRLTRAQFKNSYHPTEKTETVFDAQEGLQYLSDIFRTIDRGFPGGKNIQDSCRKILEESRATYDPKWLPLARDAASNFVDPQEIFGADFKPPCTAEQEGIFRRNRNLFTSGEDNLVLRGVNLYGEKQWILLGDRFLPDRSVNIISQRYSKLCVMLYRANGIDIGEEGELKMPPKLVSVDDVDEEAAALLKRVDPPAVLNVHRWSIGEDLTILKSVPIFGTMWAEIAARFLPHRDRGHIRKRYLVLERRVKAAVVRERKHEETYRLLLEDKVVSPSKKLLPANPQKQQKEPPVTQRKAPPTNSRPDPRTFVAQRPLQPPYVPPTGHHDPRMYRPSQPIDPRVYGHHYYPSHLPPKEGYSPHAPYPLPHYPHHYPPGVSIPLDPRATHADSGVHASYQHPYPAAPFSPPLQAMDRSLGAEASTLHEEGSRAAFEKLVDESHKHNTARPPTEGGTFSMLDSYRPSSGKQKEEKENGLLAGVLRRSDNGKGSESNEAKSPESRREESALEKLSSVATRNLMPPPVKGVDKNEPKQEDSVSFQSPKKARKATFLDTPSRGIPNTPSRAFPGTPTAPFSPQFGIMFSPGNPLKMIGSPSITLQTFPGGEVGEGSNFASQFGENSNMASHLEDNTSNLAGPHLANEGGNSLDGQDLKKMFEAASSRQSGIVREEDPATSSPTKASQSSALISSRSLFGEGATLMENDLEAISALNSLSHSPAKPSLEANKVSDDASESSGKTKKATEGRSLFSKVTGNSARRAKTNPKKRNLHF